MKMQSGADVEFTVLSKSISGELLHYKHVHGMLKTATQGHCNGAAAANLNMNGFQNRRHTKPMSSTNRVASPNRAQDILQLSRIRITLCIFFWATRRRV